jgi:hypothetical protein
MTGDHLDMDKDFNAQVRQARWAVQRWQSFPVDAAPRPLVLAGPAIMAERGFRSGEAKDAWFDGRYEWAVEVPEGVRVRARQGADRGRDEHATEALRITHAGFAEREFVTDRGPLVLPAYWLRGPAIDGAIWVLDPAIECWRPPETDADPPPPGPTQVQPLLWPIELGSDGRSIVIPWLGSHPVVESYPRAKIIETSTAVSAVGVRKDMGYRGWVTAVGIKHRIPARLSQPLGNRVFINLHGHAMHVTTFSERTPTRPEH